MEARDIVLPGCVARAGFERESPFSLQLVFVVGCVVGSGALFGTGAAFRTGAAGAFAVKLRDDRIRNVFDLNGRKKKKREKKTGGRVKRV